MSATTSVVCFTLVDIYVVTKGPYQSNNKSVNQSINKFIAGSKAHKHTNTQTNRKTDIHIPTPTAYVHSLVHGPWAVAGQHTRQSLLPNSAGLNELYQLVRFHSSQVRDVIYTLSRKSSFR